MARSGSLDGLLASREIVIVCGPGGVGKTTTAASAAAMAACHYGGRVLVVTVDPARRLADALGISGHRQHGAPDPRRGLRPGRRQAPRGALGGDARHQGVLGLPRAAPRSRCGDTREQILANPLYRNISGRFVQSHDYIAMERLYELHSTGSYDLIVVDTPPSHNALDFLDAPQRMADFFSSRLLRWLIVPYRSRLMNAASKPFYQVADRILGTQFLGDISEFFVLFQTMYEGFVERAEAVTRLLSDRRTTFMVVSTLEAIPVREAEFFADELVARRLHLGAIVVNKVLPSYFRSRSASRAAEHMGELAAQLAAKLPTDPQLTERVLREVSESFANFAVVARREAKQQAELAIAPEVVASVPYFDHDVTDMRGLLDLGGRIWH